MSDKTSISWTDATWNPVTGCSHVSEGCRNCYAEALSLRFGRSTLPWTAPNAAENVKLHPERLGQPYRWRAPRRVFVNSMSDLFHERVPFEFIAQVWDVMFDCAGLAGGVQHTFQILTKRPERMLAFARWMNQTQLRAIDYPNVWLGVSVEDQRAADERIPLLLQTPAAVHFLSCEPLLGPVDLRSIPYHGDADYLLDTLGYRYRSPHVDVRTHEGTYMSFGMCSLGKVDWVIAGGESGPHYRPMNLAWAASLRDQCQATGVPFFFKQASGRLPGKGTDALGREYHEFPQPAVPA